MSLMLALLPVAVSCVLILIMRFTALSSAVAGVLAGVTVAVFWPQFTLTWTLGQAVVADTWAYAFDIGLVLLGGVLLYRAMNAGGGLLRIADWVQSRIAQEMHLLMVVIFGVGVFFESATGFGVGILVTAPLLLAVGYAPMKAAFFALLSQCAVTWGALAIGTVIGAKLSGVSALQIALYSVPLSFPFLLLCGFVAVVTAGLRAKHSVTTLSGWILTYASLLSLLLWLTTYLLGVELAGCVAGAGVVLLGFLFAGGNRSRPGGRVPWAGLAPFIVLVSGLMITRLIEPIRQWSSTIRIGEFAPVQHPSCWLLAAVFATLLLLPASRREFTRWFEAGSIQWLNATTAVSGFILLGQLMKHTGMTAVLADSASAASGHYFALYAPALGALGGFLTASNASSNALFMEFQVKTASAVGMPVELASAVQNAAGSNTTLASPGRVIFAASIVGDSSAESALLRQVLPVAIGGTLGVAGLTGAYWLYVL